MAPRVLASCCTCRGTAGAQDRRAALAACCLLVAVVALGAGQAEEEVLRDGAPAGSESVTRVPGRFTAAPRGAARPISVTAAHTLWPNGCVDPGRSSSPFHCVRPSAPAAAEGVRALRVEGVSLRCHQVWWYCELVRIGKGNPECAKCDPGGSFDSARSGGSLLSWSSSAVGLQRAAPATWRCGSGRLLCVWARLLDGSGFLFSAIGWTRGRCKDGSRH